MTISATCSAEDLPERGEVRAVPHNDRLHWHPLESGGGTPRLIPWPWVTASTRPGSSASTMRERLYPIWRPCFENFGHHLQTTDVVARIEHLAGVDHRVGTASRSLLPPPSGAAIPSTARRMAPVGPRMSRRSVTVLSLGPVSIDPRSGRYSGSSGDRPTAAAVRRRRPPGRRAAP